MRRLLLMLTLLAAVIVTMTFTSCAEPRQHQENKSTIDQLLGGEHKLHRMYCANQYKFASYHRANEDQLMVKFAMQLYDSTYAVCELPATKIRVKIDSTVTTPYVKFRWNPSCMCSGTGLDYIMREKVIYMVITCKEGDFPSDVDMRGL